MNLTRDHRWQNPLPGGGPWLVLPDCPGGTHNWLNSTKKQPGKQKCVCPRALSLRADYYERMKAAYVSQAKPESSVKPTGPQYGEIYMKKAPGAVPDLRGAPCTTARGAKIFDESRITRGKGVWERREKAKALCNNECAKRIECLKWAGDDKQWDGIYGGMTLAERLKYFEQKSLEEASS